MKESLYKEEEKEGGRVVVNKKTGSGGSPGGYQGVKPGAGRLPLLIDRYQLLAPGPVTSHPFPKCDPDIRLA